jgi:PadR family transcriptional regulator PadR
VPTGKIDLLQGTLDVLVLRTLSQGPLHGYGIAQAIYEKSDEVLQVEEGSLYPALHRMERRGWIGAEWGISHNNRRAKFYRLTREGKKALQNQEGAWKVLSGAIQRVLGNN